MTVIVKTHSPRPGRSAGTMIVEERTWKGTVPVIGEPVFVWTSETQGGDGLSVRGEIAHVHRMQSGVTRLTFRPDGRWVMRPLRTADLAPYRSARDGSPIAMLAEKLYYHAHNKIAALSAEEEQFLNRRFGWERP